MSKYYRILLLCAAVMLGGCSSKPISPYEPNLESLSRHGDAPEWFRDAKLGIYFHWGIYSVPAYETEWYPRWMHDKRSYICKHHTQTWGDPLEFEYADFVPMFKAESFDPDQWAALFKKAGARFAGPVAEHHDGFSMWDSEVTPWNSMDKGPHRDITGELAKSIRKQDMKLITTFHHARNSLWQQKPGKWIGHFEFVKKNYPELLGNPKKAMMYGYMPRDKFIEMWQAKLKEVIDNYRPDIIWFDSWLDEIPLESRYEFASYYLNSALEWNKDVVIVRKQDDLPIEFSVLDHEKSRTSGTSERVWMTDDTISTGSWCYTQNLKIKSTAKVIHALADTVSKNGVVLLNISPTAAGIIPDDQKNVLLELGRWMEINGEGIYDTRPWDVYGEGPTQEPENGFRDHHKFLTLEYSAKDIRYTCSKDRKTLYLITLGRPEGDLTPQKLRVAVQKGSRISLLGSDKPVGYRVDNDAIITLNCDSVDSIPQQCAYVFKLENFDFKSIK